MSTIICRRVSFAYDSTGNNVFSDLDLTLDSAWRCALAGRNGRGKTTLLRLIHGTLTPDAGTIERAVPTRYFPLPPAEPAVSAWVAARRAVGPFEAWETAMQALLQAGDETSLTRYGELQSRYQQAGGYDLDARLARELELLEVGSGLWHQPFDTLSGGEQTRCLLAALFAGRDGFALIDEPTNHLDRNGRAQLARYLAGKTGFLLVSHDRAFLDACVDHVVALNADTVETHAASFSVWRAGFEQRLAGQQARNASLRREIAGFEATADARRNGALKREGDKAPHTDKGFIGSRAARQMKRALAAERRARDAAQARRQTLADQEKSYRLALPDGAAGSGALVTANDLTVVRGRPLFAPLSFRVTPGERVAVSGPNGCGKTSLLALLAGESLDYRGVLARPGHIRVVRCRQMPLWTHGNLSRLAGDSGIDVARLRQVMAALGVRGTVLDQPLETLSQGQRRKLELARSFLQPADLLLWDEPLNYLDLEAREAVEAAVLAASATLVFVEHDATFVARVATRQLRLAAP